MNRIVKDLRYHQQVVLKEIRIGRGIIARKCEKENDSRDKGSSTIEKKRG